MPTFFGIREALFYFFKFEIKNKKMRILGIAIGIVFIILCHWFVIGITTLIYLTTAGDYISAVLSAVFLSIMCSENLYQKPKEKIDSVVKAFKKGYTNLMSKYLIAIYLSNW